MIEQCRNCHFYFAADIRNSETTYSICRIDPPTVILVGDTLKSVWPFVRPDNWCGSYERKRGTV